MSYRSVATLTVVGQANKRVSKELMWAPAQGDDLCIRNDETPCAWRPPPVKQAFPLFYTFVTHDTPDLTARYELRERLVRTPNEALFLGALAEGVQPGSSGRRNQKNLVDVPRQFLTFDVDGLELGVDVIEEDGQLHSYLTELWEKIDEPELTADCLLHLSSSHGLLKRTELRANVEWQLAQPMTLKEQKAYAQHLNKKLKAAGYSDKVLDTTIYESARLMFTSEPRLYARTLDGDVTRPQPPVRRARLIKGEARTVPKPVIAPEPVAAIRRLTGAPPARNSRLVAGEVYKPLTARIMAVAANTPEMFLASAKEELRAQLRAELEALGDYDGTLEKHLSWVADPAYTNSWNGALAKRDRYALVPGDTSERPGHAVADVRTTLESVVRRARERAELRKMNALLDEEGNVPPVRHELISLPPGVGKTYAALKALMPDYITTNRALYVQPRLDLGADVAKIARGLAPTEYHRSLVRQHKGREELCEEPTYGALCAQYERVGRSPVDAVCKFCPRYDACPWPAQRADHGSGIVVQQHAHVTSTMARMHGESMGAPDFSIIDETLLSTVLGDPVGQSIKKLRKLGTRLRKKNDATSNFSTADLVANRKCILDLCEASTDRIPVERLGFFREFIPYGEPVAGQRLTRTRLADAIELERRAAAEYGREMREATAAVHEAQAAGKPTKSGPTRWAARQIEVCDFFLELYRAIDASLFTKRPHVRGVRIDRSGRPKIKVHIRNPLPPVWLERDGVWMDGTADPEIWTRFFGPPSPALDLTHWDVPVALGTYHLTQYADRPYSKGWLASHPAHLERLKRFILWQAAQHSKVLVVAQLAIESALKPLPANVATEHFNDLTGSNDYKDYPCAIIVGRPMPSPQDLELQTEAFHFDDGDSPEIVSAGGRAHMGVRKITLRGGGVATVKCEQHPDPRVHALQKQRAEAEVRQAIHRLRLYDRSEANPAEIHVFGQADTKLAVDELLFWRDAERRPSEVLAAGRVFPDLHDLAERLAGGLLSGLERRQVGRALSDARKRLLYASTYCDISLKKSLRGTEKSGLSIKANVAVSCRVQPELRSYRVRLAGLPSLYRLDVLAGDEAEAGELIARSLSLSVTSIEIMSTVEP